MKPSVAYLLLLGLIVTTMPNEFVTPDNIQSLNFLQGFSDLKFTKMAYFKYRLGFNREPDFVGHKLTKEEIQEYIEHILGPENLTAFNIQAKNSGIKELLSISVVLAMTCKLYKENKSLPKRAELMEMVVFETIDKALLNYKLKFSNEKIDNCLTLLGKLSWEALARSSEQLHIHKVRI